MATTTDGACRTDECRTDEYRTDEYEKITRGHPWERGRGSREVLQCPNCLLDLDLMRIQGETGKETVAARLMPSAATRIGAGLERRPCPGTALDTDKQEGASYFLQAADPAADPATDPAGMVRVGPEDFYQALTKQGIPRQSKRRRTESRQNSK